MLDLQSVATLQRCARCGTELPPTALACPACSALVHRDRLQDLAARATEATAQGERQTARALWQQARDLLPPESEQHREIGQRLATLSDEESAGPRRWKRDGGPWLTRVVGLVVAVGLLVAGKLKFLLLGLSKLSTFASMFGFIAVYWSIYGWPLAVGIAVSIYIHEMGHVAMLRRLGIRADAPLFIPGVGALVMLKERVTDPVVDARIGLAGPIWGLGAAASAFAVHHATGHGIWLAIAELTGFLNLFNLIPIWQLDGARGFHALSQPQRVLVLAAVGVALWLTGVGVLWILGGVAAYQTFRSRSGPGHTPSALTFAGLVLALSWFARAVGN